MNTIFSWVEKIGALLWPMLAREAACSGGSIRVRGKNRQGGQNGQRHPSDQVLPHAGFSCVRHTIDLARKY
jgi:hypothetical protein